MREARGDGVDDGRALGAGALREDSLHLGQLRVGHPAARNETLPDL